MTELARAHYLTGDSCYLATAVASCGFGSGANPDNLCYTTGAGVRNVVNILHHDSRITGQPAPAGITVAGPQNMRFSNRDGFIPNLRKDVYKRQPWTCTAASWGRSPGRQQLTGHDLISRVACQPPPIF